MSELHGEFHQFTLKPGDFLIYTAEYGMTRDEIDQLRTIIREEIPDWVPVLIVGSGDLSLYKKVEPDD